jgi:cytochrome b561
MLILLAVLLVGWVAASVIGTQAYFMGEQTKPIHERNWRSASFEQLAQSVTGQETDFSNRVPAFTVDAYTSQNLPTV